MMAVESPAAGQVGVLARDFGVRLLNCSSSGCLLETSTPMEVGTTGTLRIVINGQDLADHVLVVRCQAIQGAGAVHHVGARFLSTDSPVRQTIRHTVGHPAGETARVLLPKI